ncbi:tyrosine-type recombinase/integrase [Streptosporangium sp. CA-135522]|uniref:tyrosine-type recombinase/integrase n=1 Tax=Streptosporangium sp. CA-135522 TaxID=3240072 RepID=UPI003D920B2C
MTTRHLTPIIGPTGPPTAAALADYLRWFAGYRGKSGRVTSPETVRAYACALPTAFAGIMSLTELEDGPGRDRLHRNIRTAWGHRAPATFNAKRAAVASALAYFQQQEWIGDAATVLHGLGREHQPRPEADRIRPREAIDRLVTDKRRPLEDRTLWSMLYATAARADEVLCLDIADLDRPNLRARCRRKGGKQDELLYDIRTARLLGRLLAGRARGPIFLSRRIAPDDGTVPARDIDPVSRRRRMSYRTAERHLDAATGGWDLHDLRHSRLTHAGEDGATEADLMSLSGHEDRRTLRRYLKPSRKRHPPAASAAGGAGPPWDGRQALPAETPSGATQAGHGALPRG